MSSPSIVRPPDADDLAAAVQAVRRWVTPTPVLEVSLAGRRVWLKLDSLAPTGSFKVRGALAALDHVARTEPGRSVVACSAGNHALGIAYAAGRLSVDALVVLPETASARKIAGLRALDVELVLFGSGYDEAEHKAIEIAEQRDARFVSPYNDTHVIAGQATMATEVLHQVPTMSHLFVAVGGGGLAAGSTMALAGTEVLTHGVQVEQNAAFAAVFAGGTYRESDLGPTIADGVAGGFDSKAVTLEILRHARFELEIVGEEETRAATRRAGMDFGVVCEGSAGLALAGAIRRADQIDGEIVIGMCGRNITAGLLAEILA